MSQLWQHAVSWKSKGRMKDCPEVLTNCTVASFAFRDIELSLQTFSINIYLGSRSVHECKTLKRACWPSHQCLRHCRHKVFNIPRVQCLAGQWTVARGWLYAGRMFCARTRSPCLRVLPCIIVISVFNGLSFVIRWVTPCHNMTADDMGWCDHWVTVITLGKFEYWRVPFVNIIGTFYKYSLVEP